MAGDVGDRSVRRLIEVPGRTIAVDSVMSAGAPQSVGRFNFFLEEERWEWSDAVACMHGYRPGTVVPTTELILRHQHPDDRASVAEALEQVLSGEPFSSRHRIIDGAGCTRTVVVVGDLITDPAGAPIGIAGFYVDVTKSVQSDVAAGISEMAGSRERIDQAKGVLMAAYDITAARAFDLLVRRSQETNVKVRDLAADFLAAIEGRMSNGSRIHVDRALSTVK